MRGLSTAYDAVTDPTDKAMTREMAGTFLRTALDGYVNAVAAIGDSSPLMASGTFARNGLSQDTEALTTAYRVDWLVKKIIDMPSEDITRAWYTLSTTVPEEMVRQLKQLEAAHSVKQEMTNAIRWARLYGGSLAVMVIRGEEDRLDQPLDMDILLPDCFQGLLVLDRTMAEPSLELVSDLDDPDFGLPEYYTVHVDVSPEEEKGGYHGPKEIKVHHSRALQFTGRELPEREMIRESYWGASELEHIWEEIQKRSATSANIAQLIFQANITTLKMGNLGAALCYGTENSRNAILQAIENENALRTSYGLQLLSATDSMENHPYSFAGISEVYESFMMDMAGAAEIPATKLFGRAPQGMNATGESDLRNYYDMIAQGQERLLRPALEKLLPVMAISCWGYVPEDMEMVFEPAMTTSPAERASLSRQLADEVAELVEKGIITPEEARAELKERGKTLGSWGKIN